MSEEEQKFHHHHHHHHHHSESGVGRTGQGLTYRNPASGESYSVRSFGKLSSDERVLPEGTLSVAVFSALLTALVIAPLVVTLFFRNKALTDKIDSLRTEMGVLMEQIEKGELQAAEAAKAASAPKTRYVVDDDEKQNTTSVEKQPPRKSLVSEEDLAKAVNMDKDGLAALKKSMKLMPNGMLSETNEDGETEFTPDAIAQNLVNGYNLLACGQMRDAASVFELIVSAKPQWPYGHFFLAVATGSKAEMNRAGLLFTTAKALNEMPDEAELYYALTSFFQKKNYAAENSVSRLTMNYVNAAKMQIGPVLVPKFAPADVMKKLRAIRGMNDMIKEIDWQEK